MDGRDQAQGGYPLQSFLFSELVVDEVCRTVKVPERRKAVAVGNQGGQVLVRNRGYSMANSKGPEFTPRDVSSPATKAPEVFTLRPYQEEAVKAVHRELEKCRSTLLVMSTGAGKTATFCHIAKHWPGRCLILAENREIVTQNAAAAERHCGEVVGVEMADLKAYTGGFLPRIVCGTVQTLKSKLRLLALKPKDISLVICDEAHHRIAPSYGRVIDMCPNAKVLGVTATPDRLHKKGLEKWFDSVAFEYSILDGIKDKYLSPIKQRIVFLRDLYLDVVRTKGGDLDSDQLAELLEQDKPLHSVANYLETETEGRQTLVFSPSVKCAHRTADILNDRNPGCAVAIDANTPKPERKAHLEAYGKGEFRYLLNFGVFLEGWDCFRVGCVAMARPTKSRQTYCQAVGRGLRICPSCKGEGCEVCGDKKDLLVLDFVGQSKRHKLISTFDLIAEEEDHDKETVKRAKAKARDYPLDVRMALAAAAQEIEEEERKRRARIYSVATYDTEGSDPFGTPEAVSINTGRGDGAPTMAQMQFLTRNKLWTKGLTKGEASAIIGEFMDRKRNGLWSQKQEALIRRLGYRGEPMAREDATRWLSWRLKDSKRKV